MKGVDTILHTFMTAGERTRVRTNDGKYTDPIRCKGDVGIDVWAAFIFCAMSP